MRTWAVLLLQSGAVLLSRGVAMIALMVFLINGCRPQITGQPMMVVHSALAGGYASTTRWPLDPPLWLQAGTIKPIRAPLMTTQLAVVTERPGYVWSVVDRGKL